MSPLTQRGIGSSSNYGIHSSARSRIGYVILDHDTKFNAEMIAFLKSTGLKPKRTSVQAPWQNGIAERWVGSARREILDHVIALNEGLSSAIMSSRSSRCVCPPILVM